MPQIAGLTAAALLLAACGGGGGGGSDGGGGSSSSNKATACLNKDLYDVGTQVDQSTRGPREVVYTDSTVTQKTNFGGVANLTETEALEKKGLPQAPNIIYQTRRLRHYTRLDGTTLRNFGDVTTASTADLVTDPFLEPFRDPLVTSVLDILGSVVGSIPVANELVTVTETATNTPAIEKRFDLSPGQSYIQNYSTTTIRSASATGLNGLAIPIINSSSTTSIKTTYVGRERITVQAGTFDACKFVDEVTTQGGIGQGGTATTTTWLVVGSGLFLMLDTDTFETTELLDATINGDQLQ